ncbi:MAG: RsbRD N-terminal domain-containing protein, partial [Pyrinomonadaceae bacterium]
MQMLQRTSQDDLTDSKLLLRQGADEIARRWLTAVRADYAIPSTKGVEEPLLLNALPLVLDEILRVTELDDGKIDHEKICSAARHGRGRSRQHSAVRDPVRKCPHLREHVFLYLHQH